MDGLMEMDARAFHPRPSIHCQEMVEWMTTLVAAGSMHSWHDISASASQAQGGGISRLSRPKEV